jgi:uncharacterized protein (DUF4213/DUF364 family)
MVKARISDSLLRWRRGFPRNAQVTPRGSPHAATKSERSAFVKLTLNLMAVTLILVAAGARGRAPRGFISRFDRKGGAALPTEHRRLQRGRPPRRLRARSIPVTRVATPRRCTVQSVSAVAELLDLVNQAAAALPLPPVAQALFPPDRKGTGKPGEFCALRLADGSVGTAFVLLGDTLALLQARRPAELVGRPALEVARRFASGDPVDRALGLAAVNAVTQHVFREAGYEPELAADSLGSLQIRPGDRIGMIGFFPPLVEEARAQGLPLTVVELRAELVRETPGLSVTLDPARLKDCNKIVSTSTVLLNDTLEEILAGCRHAEALALIGPSASCFPDPLFARGVTTMGGYWVLDPGAFMRRAAALQPWGDAGKKSCVRRDAYPGTGALLREAAGRRAGARRWPG